MVHNAAQLRQVVTELPLALSLSFPPTFTRLIQTIRVVLLDFFAVFHLDCLGSTSVHGRFIVIMASPWILAAFFRLIQYMADKRAARSGASPDVVAAQQDENRKNFAYRVTFVVFLLYPLLSKTIFTMFICQTFGPGERWHMDDFSVDVRAPIIAALPALPATRHQTVGP